MASFPSSKVHRRSRRSLSRGQHVQVPGVTGTPVATTTTVVFTFSAPVVVSGTIPLHLSGSHPLVSQVQNSPTEVTQVYSATVVGDTWSLDSSAPVATFQGGALAPASGTF
jgi:hypothetical protein